jgi:hypothetical protein
MENGKLQKLSCQKKCSLVDFHRIQMEKLKSKFEFVTLPFTSKIKGSMQVPKSSGLNWGQRPGREQNQAYLSIPAYIQKSFFFPEQNC